MGRTPLSSTRYLRPPANIVSPLRYPGAKRRLAGYVGEALKLNGLKPKLFVEPFAGGASVALQLLYEGRVVKIALGEIDPLVASFWQTVADEPDWLIERICSIRPSVAEWKLYKHGKHRTVRERAIACLFLNRTSFSGILAPSAGPIGGISQASEYDIGCRFNAETLSKRISQLSLLRKRIKFVANADWKRTISRALRTAIPRNDIFFYLDPPFFGKAQKLYTYHFSIGQHVELRDALLKLHSPWLLSYDPAEYIVSLYQKNEHSPRTIEHLYSASGSNNGSRGRAAELIISNLPRLPRRTRTWRTKQEWTTDRP